MFIWMLPSPVTQATVAPGCASCTPIAAGRPKPIVPKPPELIQRRGLSNSLYDAPHICGWPTSDVMNASPLVSLCSVSITYCGLMSSVEFLYDSEFAPRHSSICFHQSLSAAASGFCLLLFSTDSRSDSTC